MKILLPVVGTRGDVEPFLAIGALLAARGHEVVVILPEQFCILATEAGLKSISLGPEFIDFLNSKDGRLAMGGSGGRFAKIFALVRLAFKSGPINNQLVERQQRIINREQPDRILYHGKAIYPVLWSINHPGRAKLLISVPDMHPVPGRSHIGFHTNLGPWLNSVSYRLANWGLFQAVWRSIRHLGLRQNYTKREVKKELFNAETAYAVSPTLFPRPAEWPANLRVLGYHQRKQPEAFKPPPELEAFLAKHARVMVVTFGSMLNPNPTVTTQLMLEATARLEIPTIFIEGAGGLLTPKDYDRDRCLFLKRVPYSWLFPRVYAVVHHGGSGTTHLSTSAGCATLIIPHLIDQFVWNRINAKLGKGPLGVSMGKLSLSRLAPKLEAVWREDRYRLKAQELAIKMRAEDFEEALVEFVMG